MRRCCSKRARARRRSSRSSRSRPGLKPDRRPAAAILCGQPQRATWSPSSGRCGSRASGRSRSPASPRPTRKSPTYYNANKATYAPSDTRSLSQVVVPDQATANAIAQRAKGGATAAAAAAPAGANAAVTTLTGPEPRRPMPASPATRPPRRCSRAAQGAVVGPIQSDFGWVVVKVEAVKAGGGKTLDQARAEIAAKLTADKRKARDRGPCRQGAERARRRQQLRRGGRRREADGRRRRR